MCTHVFLCSQVELNKKGDDDKEEDKDGDYSQEEYGTRIDTAEQLEAETEDLKVEEVLLEVQKDLSAFVEIDLRDEVEEITEHFLTEEKQPEEEEEPAELEPKSNWLCCFPTWTKQKKKRIQIG
ncbi:uncharacterized protein C13orf46 homolog [Lepidochelys kempii]|uniref:uncharacterized protein C13orf46 homolog n=1 Tax=Lepidochelys kempii TaxID=8472 RepID=UPI003C6F1B4B